MSDDAFKSSDKSGHSGTSHETFRTAKNGELFLTPRENRSLTSRGLGRDILQNIAAGMATLLGELEMEINIGRRKFLSALGGA
jgi:hypothetical protein